MPRDKFGHLKHADLLFAVEDRFQVLVGIDQSLFLFILQFSLADIVPELFGQFGTGQGLGTDNLGQHLIRLNGLPFLVVAIQERLCLGNVKRIVRLRAREYAHYGLLASTQPSAMPSLNDACCGVYFLVLT
jgi:hypothetical protein